jgi:transposase
MDKKAARALTDRIKAALEGTWQLVREAYEERAWAALGHSSWDDYCTEEFGTLRIRLPREERSEVVASLREAGMSVRAIASATGYDGKTIRNDLAGEENSSGAESDMEQPAVIEPKPVQGTDGKHYPASRPAPRPREPVRKTRRPSQKLDPDDVDRQTWPLFDEGTTNRVDVAEKTGIGEITVRMSLERWKATQRLQADSGSHPGRKDRQKDWEGKTGPQRVRAAQARKRLDRGKTFADLADFHLRISQMCLILEDFDVRDYSTDEAAALEVAYILDDLITLGEWHDRQVLALTNYAESNDVLERIRKLRSTDGRSPEEAETALRLADRIERRLNQGSIG